VYHLKCNPVTITHYGTFKAVVSQHTYGGTGGERMYSSYSFTTSALDGGWVVSVTPQLRFNPKERTPSTHCAGGWVDPRASLDTKLDEKSFRLCWGLNLDCPFVQSVVRHYTDWATQAPHTMVPKQNQMSVYPCVTDSPSLPCDAQINVTLVARPLLMPVAQTLCRWEHGVFMRRIMFFLKHCHTSHWTWVLLSVKHLAMCPDKEITIKTTIYILVTKCQAYACHPERGGNF
jgi:hypothetical protein